MDIIEYLKKYFNNVKRLPNNVANRGFLTSLDDKGEPKKNKYATTVLKSGMEVSCTEGAGDIFIFNYSFPTFNKNSPYYDSKASLIIRYEPDYVLDLSGWNDLVLDSDGHLYSEIMDQVENKIAKLEEQGITWTKGSHWG